MTVWKRKHVTFSHASPSPVLLYSPLSDPAPFYRIQKSLSLCTDFHSTQKFPVPYLRYLKVLKLILGKQFVAFIYNKSYVSHICILKDYRIGVSNFFLWRARCNYCRCNYSALLLWGEISHRQNVNEWLRPDLTLGRSDQSIVCQPML